MKKHPDELTLRVQRILPLSKRKQTFFDKKKHYPKRRMLRFDTSKSFVAGKVTAHKSCFDSVDKLAEIVYNYWGSGTWNIMFAGWGRNKKFRRRFSCPVQKGGYCEFKGKQCHKWRWYKYGLSCKKNPINVMKIRKRGRITIRSKMSIEKPFSYKWHSSHDLMGKMRIGFKRN